MRKYDTLIFDLDDTLIDNRRAVSYAFSCVLKKMGLQYSDELFDEWLAFDKEYWWEWESGQMQLPDYVKTLEQKRIYLRANRFLRFFNDKGISFSLDEAKGLNDYYCGLLAEDVIEIEGAKSLLNELKDEYFLVIATNGPKMAALKKLGKIEVLPIINEVICSEEIGCSKPMIGFFSYMFRKIPERDKSRMLLIGDSLNTDILGGNRVDIDTCWFNPNQESLESDIRPTMEIHKLKQLRKKL